MILYRCFAWNEHARRADSDGPLWFPRAFQGEGRHDNPDLSHVQLLIISCNNKNALIILKKSTTKNAHMKRWG